MYKWQPISTSMTCMSCVAKVHCETGKTCRREHEPQMMLEVQPHAHQENLDFPDARAMPTVGPARPELIS